ncbi:MAG: hypothetical protein AAF447_12955 [Myxococcota bacterium]
MSRRFALALFFFASALACGEGEAELADASVDLATVDASRPGSDAGPSDAGDADAGDAGAGDADAGDGPSDSPPARVLFVGNSYTFYNDLPQLYATTTGRMPAPDVDDVTAGGRRLVRHAGDAALAGRLAEGWDVVVLQEQSQIPGFPAGNPDREASLSAAVDLATAAGEARIVLYLTWGRQRGDERNAALFPDFETMQTRLNEGYAAMRDAIEAAGRDVVIAPVGPAFREVRDQSEALFDRLYASDGSHPSPLGSLLAALVFARTLDGAELGTLATPDGIAPEDWAQLVAAAEAAAL